MEAHGGHEDIFRTTGVLQALFHIFRDGTRDVLRRHVGLVLGNILSAVRAGESSTSSLHRKLTTKVTQRIALVFLPPRVALWRYQRGSRSLVDNCGSGGADGADGADGSGARREGSSGAAGADAAAEEDEAEVPDELDELVDVLLTGLRDRDTVVRWSAAKGIGRLTGRLPHRDW